MIPIQYKGIEVDAELRCDFLIEEKLVVELKSVTEMKPIFEAQILSYMNLLKRPIGLLINFNVTNIYKEGQKTYINNLYNQFGINLYSLILLNMVKKTVNFLNKQNGRI